jgi:hypothetical protein
LQAAHEATQRIEAERQQVAASVKAEVEERKDAIEQTAQIDQVNAAFDVASKATPATEIAKGTVVKQKYQAKSHKGHVAIIQWWVANCMNLMTLEELQTKLSFMRTAADKSLNEGKGRIEADGLEVVEDYSTRTTRSREESLVNNRNGLDVVQKELQHDLLLPAPLTSNTHLFLIVTCQG